MSALKLGFLAIRTIAKPIANSIKAQSVKHPKFKEACIGVAQFTHRAEMNLKMKFLGYKVESIRPLNDARAVEMGANFLGEAIIFGVAGSLIILENARTRMNAKNRKNHVDDTLDNLLVMTEELREEFKELAISSRSQIEELQRENVQLKRTLNEILDVSLRLRSHTPYSASDVGIGNSSGGFILNIGPSDDEQVGSGFVPEQPQQKQQQQQQQQQSPQPSAQGVKTINSDNAGNQHHHGRSDHYSQEEYVLIDPPTYGSSTSAVTTAKKSSGLWDSLPWSKS